MLKTFAKKVISLLPGSQTSFAPEVRVEDSAIKPADAASSFVLFTSLYNEPDPQRVEELLYCLYRNLGHPLIDNVFVVYDTSRDNGKSTILEAISGKENVIVFKFSGRPKFSDLFSLANRRYPQRQILVANSDIYFDHTLARIDFQRSPNLFFVLSRRNSDESRQGGFLIKNNSGLPNFLSADAWIFLTPLPPITYAEYELGTMYSDSFLNTQLLKSFPHVINPCLEVNAFHLQNDVSESQAIDESKRSKFAAIYELERKRSRDSELSSGLHWRGLPESDAELDYNYRSYWSKKNLIVDLRNKAILPDENIVRTFDRFATENKICVWLLVDDFYAWSKVLFPIRGNYINLTTSVDPGNFAKFTGSGNLTDHLEKYNNVVCQADLLYPKLVENTTAQKFTNPVTDNKNIAQTHTPSILIDVQFGLSNRIRALASAYLLAKNTGRRLILIWQPDIHCNCKFDDLFTDHSLEVADSNVFELSLMDRYDYMNAPLRREGKLGIIQDSARDIYIKSAYTLDYKFYNKEKEDEFIRALKPIGIVEEALSKYDVADMIGLHVRMGGGENFDLERWDSDEFLDATGKEMMNYWRGKSHFKTFIPLVEKILDKNPQQRFFLAADMQLVYDVFMEKFPDNIVFHSRNIFDRSKEQQITALVDLYCLSRTRMIYGSNWSSFTEVAARLGNKELKLSGVHF